MTTYFVGFLTPLKAFDKFIPEGFTLVPVERRHLALVYLGERVRVDELREKLEALPPIRPFRATFRGLAAFPSMSKARYLAVVPTAESASLLQSLRDEVVGILQEHRDRYSVFKPHVSIARTRLKPSLELYKRVAKAVRASSLVSETLELRELFLMEAEAGEVRPLYKLSLRG